MHRLRGSLLQYIDTPEALEWHQSENIRRGFSPIFIDASAGDDDNDDGDDDADEGDA